MREGILRKKGRRSPPCRMSVSISERKIRRVYRVDIKPIPTTLDHGAMRRAPLEVCEGLPTSFFGAEREKIRGARR
jgi:hypothetical protein